MISGATGLGKPGAGVANAFGPITTGSFRQFGDNELGSPDGIRAGAIVPSRDGVQEALGRAKFVNRFTAARQTLQNHLLTRGMTPYFPEGLAGPLADPILYKKKDPELGWKSRKRVDIDSVDLNALAQKAGSRLMLSAFVEALGKAIQDSRYLTVDQYTGIVADAFMADPKTAVVWHMMGSGFETDAGKEALVEQKSGSTALSLPSIEELNQYIGDLACIVGGAQLLSLKKRKPQWRMVTLDLAASLDPVLLTALTDLQGREQHPTVAKVLDTAVNALKKGPDEVDPGNNGGDSGGKGGVNRFETMEARVSGTIHRI